MPERVCLDRLMSRRKIETGSAPRAIGPYSQAVAAGGMLYVSGQVPLDPETGKLVEGGIVPQARQVMRNLSAVLDAAGIGWEDVARTTIYITNMAAFQEVNTVYAEFVVEPYPARATVEVSALPLGALVEIDLVAVLPDFKE